MQVFLTTCQLTSKIDSDHTCFSGVNGAGKTTTFRMLTGDETPSSGDAFINSASILKDMDRARMDIGYCPQFDALFSKLTADEHLKFYARLKGLDEPSTQEVGLIENAKTRQITNPGFGLGFSKHGKFV